MKYKEVIVVANEVHWLASPGTCPVCSGRFLWTVCPVEGWSSRCDRCGRSPDEALRDFQTSQTLEVLRKSLSEITILPVSEAALSRAEEVVAHL